METEKRKGFYDLEVYQNTYSLALLVIKKVVCKLPKEEKYDLAQQLRRSSKAVPRLIVEAYSKRHQKRGFQPLLDTAIEESNETIVSLSQARDIYNIDTELCTSLMDSYDKASRQMFNLAIAWTKFQDQRNPATPTPQQYVAVTQAEKKTCKDNL